MNENVEHRSTLISIIVLQRSDIMKQWYAVYTKPNSECLVETTLQQRDVETYLPKIIKPLKPGKSSHRVPLFPCYLFIHVDIAHFNPLLWQWIPGLVRIVSTGNHPQPVPDFVIRLMQKKLSQINRFGDSFPQNFKPGESVRVSNGPLSGMLAIFEKSTSSRDRVQILLNFLGQVKKVNIDASDIEKAPPQIIVSIRKPPRRTRGRGRKISN